ncbi:Hsp90 co-chaperone Cdc37 [Spathaspora sp. JA1]|nr:Hsp90 co-chaperone Cdc37 [Spathaspora sp. JA1]
MPIDYSKWDKIELSDDSDIEVHPNVDKQSFIRWKQRDIHEKRNQRNIEIKSILIQLTMYRALNTRVDYILDTLSESQLLDQQLVLQTLDSQFDKGEKFNYDKLKQEKGDELRKGLRDLTYDESEIENTPCYNEMIEDLFIQIKEDHPDAREDGAKLKEYLKEHRNKIDDVLSKQTIKLDDLLYQKSMLISSDDIHTGFDRSFLNKKDEDEDEPVLTPAPSEPATKTTTTTTETINSPSVIAPPAAPAAATSDEDADLHLETATAEFAKIPVKDLSKSADFLIKHTYIISEQQKDALIMTAFDHQLSNDSPAALQTIHQSLLLQYIAQLAGPHHTRDQAIRAIKLFMSKIADEDSPAHRGFMEDLNNTFKHIQTRCEVIKKEQEENDDQTGEELIQLRALDENTELQVNIPVEGTPEYEIFKAKLSPEFQKAILTQSLDEVNKEFAKLKVEEAEQVLEVFNECGVIGITDYLEDEQEFEELKKEYNQENQGQVEDIVD